MREEDWDEEEEDEEEEEYEEEVEMGFIPTFWPENEAKRLKRKMSEELEEDED